MDVGPFLNVNLSKTQEIMIIKVEISEETMARMLTGKRVEGTIGYDLMTGKKTFNAFHRRKEKMKTAIREQRREKRRTPYQRTNKKYDY